MIQLADSVVKALSWIQNSDSPDKKNLTQSLAARIGAISGLKTFPVVAQRVIALLNKSDFTIDEVTDTIREDPALAAGVLRLANSPFYIPTQPINSLDMAFIRLGRNTVREAIFAVATMKMFPDISGFGKMIRDHCAATAAICYVLSYNLKIGPTEVMFLIGLMHDIGIMLFIDSGEIQYPANVKELITMPDSLQLFEQKNMQFDHAILAGQVLTRWKVGSPVPQVVAWHHLPELAYKSTAGTMVAILRIANKIEIQLTHNSNPDTDQFIADLETGDDALFLSLQKGQISGIWQKIKDARAESLKIFGS
jgi:HD-like signal output (HDOD) protein